MMRVVNADGAWIAATAIVVKRAGRTARWSYGYAARGLVTPPVSGR